MHEHSENPTPAALREVLRAAGIHRVVVGHAPNCSSAGSVVSMALFTLAGASVVMSVWAPWLTRWRTGRSTPEDGPPPAVRNDGDGGVVHHHDTGTRIHVTAEAIADLAQQGLPVRSPSTEPGPPPPTEVHLSMTGRCPVACSGCYLGAGPQHAPPDPSDLHGVLDDLASRGVLQVALGGGEAIGRLDVIGLGRAARRRGMVPNLTTSGFGVTPGFARQAAEVFGQVNVSVDGLADTYTEVRGWSGAERALAAVERLVAAGVRTGVNTVLSRPLLEVDHRLEALGTVLRDAGVSEWQWLRFKPTGRGEQAWHQLAPSPDHLDALWSRSEPLLTQLTPMQLRWDCALIPFLTESGASAELAWMLGVRGCPGADSLAARDHTGRWSACSFSRASAKTSSMATFWSSDPEAVSWRDRAAQPPEPCASCAWQSVCRGGCRIVAAHLAGDALAPDPQCPRVRRWSRQSSDPRPTSRSLR